MEKKLEEIKSSLDSLHERLDRLFYWTGFVQQESKCRYQALGSKDTDLESGQTSLTNQPQPPPLQGTLECEDDHLSARLLKLKQFI